jgi:hypothetical protein
MNYIKLIFEKLSEDQMDMLTALFSDENIHGSYYVDT